MTTVMTWVDLGGIGPWPDSRLESLDRCGECLGKIRAVSRQRLVADLDLGLGALPELLRCCSSPTD